MNWVAPIRDEKQLESFLAELRKMDEKYYIMFRIGVGTGLQLQEILQLKVGDVRGREAIEVRIGTKGIRRTFYFPEDLRKDILAFTEGREEDDFLIYGHSTRRKQPLSREQAYRAMKAAGEASGLESVGAQTMRKTFAWRYFSSTGDICYIQNLLNHSSASITYRYIGESPKAEIGIRKRSPQENERARARLCRSGRGMEQLEQIREELGKIEEGMKDSSKSDEYFGKTECLIDSIRQLLTDFDSV